MSRLDELHTLTAITTDHCVEWSGYRDRDGYGILIVNSKHWRAHRLAYTIAHQHEPAGLILHTCDNPPCVNPRHLRDDTSAANAREREARRRVLPGQIELELAEPCPK